MTRIGSDDFIFSMCLLFRVCGYHLSENYLFLLTKTCKSLKRQIITCTRSLLLLAYSSVEERMTDWRSHTV